MANRVHKIKQGDRRPSIVATLGTENDDGTIAPDNLTGCIVTLNAKRGNTLVIANGACSITDAVNGKVLYNFAPGDTTVADDLDAEFKSVDSNGTPKRYPDDGNFVIKITPNVGP